MATEKYSPNDISNLSQDWGEDLNDAKKRPFSGRAVQKFIKNRLSDLADLKFGHVTYEAGTLAFYDEENGTIISTLTLSGTIYAINLFTETPQTFSVLTSDAIKTLTIKPSSKTGSIGQEMSDFYENYTWVLSIDNGNGFRNIANGASLSGNSFSIDIRPYVSVGTNRLRFSITGDDSGQTKSIVFTCTLTSLVLTCKHDWQNAWIEGRPYHITGIYFSGNMQKTLNIRIDDDDTKLYSQTFPASASYITSPFLFNISSYFPLTTGVHKVEIWMSGGSSTTQRYTFDIMCVKAGEVNTAKLICLNEIKDPAFNYENQVLFRYAVYGATRATFNIIAKDIASSYPIATGQNFTVGAEEKTDYSLRLEIPTEEQSGVTLQISALVDAIPETKTIGVNNSNAFAAVDDAFFYMNASLRSNSASDKQIILNNMINAHTSEYPAVWSGFTWNKDGWGYDDENVKCLSIPAGSTMECDTLRPLSTVGGGQSLSLEWKLKTENVADYNTPIMSFMSDAVYNENTTNGIVVFPTKILVLSSLNRNVVQQSVNFEEGQQLHFVVVFQKGYASTGRNLCRIFVNSVQQCIFEYDGSATFGNGHLRVGQTSSDLYLYMLRYYNNTAFEADSVVKNWLNALTETVEYSRQGIRDDNDIFDGVNISYELAKKAGFNTMVVETVNDVPIPSLNRTVGSNSTLMVEYNDHPEWNFKITDAPIDGQGTTSMRYFRWNLRWKLAKVDADKGTPASVWHYADGTTSNTKGWFDGANNHLKVGRITAKKNIASSSQGHKMGATAMYDELYKQLGLHADLPAGARVAVYQYPVMGFQKYADGSYQFIGLYTIGPDKGDKDTFGYDTALYPDLMSIEGPNHAPLGTRFLHPWVDVTFSAEDETLKFGGEEGWDANNYNDALYADEASVLSLYEAEWKPAYDLVYFCSPYLKSLAETGLTLAQINADVIAFRNGSNLLGTRRNEVVTLYDSNYNLIFYRNYTRQYEVLSGHNIKTYLSTYLGGVANPTTAQLISARKARFSAEAENYFDIESLLYHENFLMLIGASDNHAKNMYPFKLESLANGGRWMFRQDDLDTILPTDNNGNSTKDYFVEPGDLTPNGTDIYQGSSSVLWTLVREVFQTRLKAMMKDMIDGLVALAASKSLTKDYIWETVFAMFDYYFWSRSARYFPVRAYAEDADFGYIHVWALNPAQTYNGIYPLTQALGTQLEAEQQWALRRIIYIFSKYEIGGFNGSVSDGLGSIEFTPGQAYTFNLVPAIDMYPTGNLGGGTNSRGARTKAGAVCPIVATSDGTTTYYLKGLDWLTSLGDLSKLVLTSRGGVSTIPFSVQSKRMRTLKVGDAVPGNVLFNATSLSVKGESFEEIDARNVKTINAALDLKDCPRIQRILLSGSSIPSIVIPTGTRVTDVEFPPAIQNIYLNMLPLLKNENVLISSESLINIKGLLVRACPNMSALKLLFSIINTPGNTLQYVALSWENIEACTSDDIHKLVSLTTPYNGTAGYGRVDYNSETKQYSYNGARPNLQGAMHSNKAYRNEIEALMSYFSALTINADIYYVYVEDEIARGIISRTWGDSTGITENQAAAITSLGSVFRNSAIVGTLDWLKNFPNLTSISSVFINCNSLIHAGLSDLDTSKYNSFFQTFQGCSNLQSIDTSKWNTYNVTTFGFMFTNCSNLRSIDVSGWDTYNAGGISNIFSGCSSLSSFQVSSGFFNCATRAESPLLAMPLALTAWVNVTQITDMLNALPDLTLLDRTGTLQLSTQTKDVITANNLSSIASAKNWTIA